MTPQIVMEGNIGVHNANLDAANQRLERSAVYRDLSTICIVPTRGNINYRVVQCWMGLMIPMNQKFLRLFIAGYEVGAAYDTAIELILGHPELSTWRYILTLEEDNLPPPDGLLKLYESMDDYDVVGGLYWTKGEGGMPMCYGNPHVFPLAFNPQIPAADRVTRCNGLGMGFTLFRVELFKKMPKPWFKTVQAYEPGKGSIGFTQDLYFANEAAKHGARFGCDGRIRVGHLDTATGIVW